MKSPGLICPRCHSTLTEEGIGLICEHDHEYPLVNGVPQFGGINYRPDELNSAQMQDVLRTTATKGWQVAMHDLLRSLDPVAYRHAIDEYRAQWRFVTPLTDRSRILSLGSGWGAVAFNLAESSQYVVAADASPEKAQFIAMRARQVDRNNLKAIQLGLDQPLPFQSAAFDAVVLVDTLSYIGDLAIQRTILKRAHEVLESSGVLILADVNRLGINQLAKRRNGTKPHTLGGYRRLLESAGFRSFRMYAPAPSHLEPFFMVPLDQIGPINFFLRNILGAQDFQPHLKQRGLSKMYQLVRTTIPWVPATYSASLARIFAPSFAVMARA